MSRSALPGRPGSTTRVRTSGCLTLHDHDVGVHSVDWQPRDEPQDTFMLGRTDHASARWQQLVDVLVIPSAPTSQTAEVLASVTLRTRTGCSLVVVRVSGREWLLSACDGNRIVVPTASGSPAEAIRWAATGYARLMSGDTLRDIEAEVHHVRWYDGVSLRTGPRS
jgi:hypothetical protein